MDLSELEALELARLASCPTESGVYSGCGNKNNNLYENSHKSGGKTHEF